MEPEKKSNGALVGLIVIILILVIGGVYLWQKSEVEAPVTETGGLENVNNEANVLEAELDALDVESVDSEI
jgi:hypothetical protein